jgi:TonB family protein
LLPSRDTAQKAFDRGDLDQKTLITVRLPSGGRETWPASDIPQFADILRLEQPEVVNDDITAITDADGREAMARKPVEGTVTTDYPHSETSVVSTIPKKSSKRNPPELLPNHTKDYSKREIVEEDSASSNPHDDAALPVAKIVGVVLTALLALPVLTFVFDSNETAMSDGSGVTAVTETEAAENSTNAAAAASSDSLTATSTDNSAATSSDRSLDAEIAPTGGVMPYDGNIQDSCSEMQGFERVICQSPELKSKDRQVRTAWYSAQQRMAQTAEVVEPLSQILRRIGSCSSRSCALSAYATEISRLENTSPQNVASTQPAEAPQYAEAKPRGNLGNWANTNDYPARALQQEREGTTGFRVTIGIDGRVIECRVTQSSGHDDLDAATCNNVKRRARFEPAVRNGEKVEGSYSNKVRWRVPR